MSVEHTIARRVSYASADFDRLYASVRDYLMPALALADEIDEAILLERLSTSKAALWVTPTSAAITSIHRTSNGRTCNVWLAGGDLGEILANMPVVEAYAINHGCATISFAGRKGWDRVLYTHSYALKHIIMEKKL